MGTIIINMFLCLLNVVCAFYNNEKGNYKVAMLNAFSAGFICCMALVLALK